MITLLQAHNLDDIREDINELKQDIRNLKQDMTVRISNCIILRGKLKEAATEYKSHVHHGGTCDPNCLIWYN